MKRITIIILTCLLASMAAMAQKGLNINRLFDGRYKKAPGATEIIVTGSQAHEIGLSVYHSVSVTDKTQAEIIENLVVKDRVQAIDKEVEYRNHATATQPLHLLSQPEPGTQVAQECRDTHLHGGYRQRRRYQKTHQEIISIKYIIKS